MILSWISFGFDDIVILGVLTSAHVFLRLDLGSVLVHTDGPKLVLWSNIS